MKKLRSVEIKIRYFLWAISRSRYIHLFDVVYYNGEKCQIINGVANPRWKIMPISRENLSKPKRDVYNYIHQDDFKVDINFKTILNRFKQSYSFQMRNWYSIDLNNPIFSRISYINSNNILFR